MPKRQDPNVYTPRYDGVDAWDSYFSNVVASAMAHIDRSDDDVDPCPDCEYRRCRCDVDDDAADDAA